MHRRKLFHRRAPYQYADAGNALPEKNRGVRAAYVLLAVFASMILLLLTASVFLKDISSQIAVSDASDIVTVSVNKAIAQVLTEGQYSGDYFVDFEKDAAGNVTAISKLQHEDSQ